MVSLGVYETDRVRIEGSCNWDELTQERQEEMKDIFAKHMADSILRQEAKGGGQYDPTHSI